LLPSLFSLDFEISLRAGGPLMRVNKVKTCSRVTPLTERQGHDKDQEHNRYRDHDHDYACPYGQRHGHGSKGYAPLRFRESAAL
jgi:hypothetical protein